MRHENDLTKGQLLYHRIQFAELICGCKRISLRLSRSAPPEKIERNNATGRGQKRDETVVKMQIVRETVHQDCRRFLSLIFPGVYTVSFSLYVMLCVVHESSKSRTLLRRSF